MKISTSTFAAVAYAILSASGLRAVPHHRPHAGTQAVSALAAASSPNALLDTATACAAASTVTVHDVQTMFVTIGANGVATTSAAASKTTTTKAAVKDVTSAAGNKATTTKAAVKDITSAAGNKAVTTKAVTTKAAGAKSTTTVTVTVTVPRATITTAPAATTSASGKTSNNNKGNTNNNKGGKNGGKIVTVTRTIKHVKPIITTITKTKNNQVVVTTTVVSTATSTEIQTVTAEASPTTIISTTTLDTPVTVTSTVTEQGQEVVKTTEILTQVVTVTSDVLPETATATIVTDSAASTAAQSSAVIDKVTSTTTTAAAASQSASTTTSAADAGATDDPQTSLTLDKRVIMTSQASDGNPSAGQEASQTSTNNFINFCLTQNVPITNGQQVKTGSCNPVPMGRILATDRMPSSVFIFPSNFGTIPANTAFTIQMKIQNLKTGNFVNANNNYYSAPAQVDETGTLIGHSHCVIEPIDSFDTTKPTDPTTFSFFKGLNGVAQGGILTADVTGGLPAGKYRIGSINAAANHQPALCAVAQHGSVDSWAYFTVA